MADLQDEPINVKPTPQQVSKAKPKPVGPPESIQLRAWRPTSDSVIIRTFVEPFAIKQIQKRIAKAWNSKHLTEGELRNKTAEEFNRLGGFTYDDERFDSAEAVIGRDKSWFFGTPIMDYLAMDYDAYINDQGQSVPAGGIMIQNLTMVVKQKKNIVKTIIPGHKGTIKQFISDGDYQIDAVGLLIAPPSNFSGSYTFNNGNKILPKGEFKMGQRPDEEMMSFIQVLKAQMEVNVYSPFLNLFDIDKCVIESHEFPNEKGKLDNQMIKFKMYSDEDFDVIINAQT